MSLSLRFCRNSGFIVRAGGDTLVFDYIGGGPRRLEKVRAVFVSHGHGDHCSPAAVRLCEGRGEFFFGGGASLEGVRGHVMAPGERYAADGLEVLALPSTDEGVAFLVKAGGHTLFHAGDLNIWHWQSEGEDYCRAQAEAFAAALAPIAGEAPEIAFFPVDARLDGDMLETSGEMTSPPPSCYGAEALVRLVPGVKRVVPMHTAGDNIDRDKLSPMLRDRLLQLPAGKEYVLD